MRTAILFALITYSFSAQAQITSTPQLLEMWHSSDQRKLSYVLGYVSGVLDHSTNEDDFCLNSRFGNRPEEITRAIIQQTEIDLERRISNLKKVEKAINTKAPPLSAADHIIMSARQVYNCKQSSKP